MSCREQKKTRKDKAWPSYMASAYLVVPYWLLYLNLKLSSAMVYLLEPIGGGGGGGGGPMAGFNFEKTLDRLK